MNIKSFAELTVWQKAHELALLVYSLTAKFPRSERFGMVSQLRRSAASVPANIAEGFGRGTTREFLRSLQIARGELEETRYFVILGRDLGHVSKVDRGRVTTVGDAVGQPINALGRSLKRRLPTNQGSRVTSHKSPITAHG